MKSTIENVEPTRAKLTIEVDYDELAPRMEAAYKDVASQVNIPGFRKGHVPPRIIDQRFGRGVVIEQVVNDVVPAYYNQAVMEEHLRPMSQPEIDVVEVPAAKGEPGGILKFTAEMDIVPEFELPELTGLEVTVEPVEVTEEAVQAELDDLRGRFATLKTLDRPAADGDFLSLDISAEVDGQVIDSLTDVSYELGSESMLEGQDEALRGASAGDEVTFTSAIRGGEYAGQDANVTAKVTAVKEKELPEVDEEFVTTVSEFDTEEELLEDLRNQVKQAGLGSQALEARTALLEQLVDDIEIVLPSGIIETEVERRLGEDASAEDKDKESEAVARELRRQLLLDELAQKRDVNITQQELMEFMFQTAQAYGIEPNQMFQDQNQIQQMVGELARTKALVSVLRDAKVTDKTGAEVDLSAFTTDPAEEAAAETAAEDGVVEIDVEEAAKAAEEDSAEESEK